MDNLLSKLSTEKLLKLRENLIKKYRDQELRFWVRQGLKDRRREREDSYRRDGK